MNIEKINKLNTIFYIITAISFLGIMFLKLRITDSLFNHDLFWILMSIMFISYSGFVYTTNILWKE